MTTHLEFTAEISEALNYERFHQPVPWCSDEWKWCGSRGMDCHTPSELITVTTDADSSSAQRCERLNTLAALQLTEIRCSPPVCSSSQNHTLCPRDV
ncbi:MAG: hypothetical protein ACYDBJ_17095 [Aggregatilineales bacterium]